MAHSAQLIDSLKTALKSHGLTYAEVAKRIDLSEASVKRMFSQKHLTLARLDEICRLIDLEISDLVQMAADRQKYISHLTVEQEKVLVEDSKLLLMAACLLNRWSVDEILETYDIPELECIQLLAKLDRMKILELLPKNRVKLLVSRNFSWLPRGPIQEFFQQKVQQDYLDSPFRDEGEKRVFVNGMLSVASNVQLIKKIEKVISEFHELHTEDIRLPLERKHGMAMLLAIRPWEMKSFHDIRKDKSKKPFV